MFCHSDTERSEVEESIKRSMYMAFVLKMLSEYGSFPLGGVYAERSEVLGVSMTGLV